MNRNDIVDRIALRLYGNTKCKSKHECIMFLDMLEEVVKQALQRGEDIRWKGFLSAKQYDLPAHSGRNPKTGEVVTYPARKQILVKMSDKIKDKVNKPSDIEGYQEQ
ncbi:MAG: HU family DNA-binding protein [Clostridia bacterium]|nr:HU family DNA-binding protein [Clostridia bacterium]